MLHRIKDLFSNQNEGRLLNCTKLGIQIPKDFVQSKRFSLGESISKQMLFGDSHIETRESMNFGSYLHHLKIKEIELFSEIFLTVFSDSCLVVVFNKTGRVVTKFDLSKYYIDEQRTISFIDFAVFPRLEWSDRYYDIQ